MVLMFGFFCLSELAFCQVLEGELQPCVNRAYKNKVGGIQTVAI